MEASAAEPLLRTAYAAFNRRDLEGALALMAPDVEWPNGMEGGWVKGHSGVREYWTRQWTLIDPHVEPVGFTTDTSGRTVVDVHQTVHDLAGRLILDAMVRHVYETQGGLITRMEIQKS